MEQSSEPERAEDEYDDNLLAQEEEIREKFVGLIHYSKEIGGNVVLTAGIYPKRDLYTLDYFTYFNDFEIMSRDFDVIDILSESEKVMFQNASKEIQLNNIDLSSLSLNINISVIEFCNLFKNCVLHDCVNFFCVEYDVIVSICVTENILEVIRLTLDDIQQKIITESVQIDGIVDFTHAILIKEKLDIEKINERQIIVSKLDEILNHKMYLAVDEFQRLGSIHSLKRRLLAGASLLSVYSISLWVLIRLNFYDENDYTARLVLSMFYAMPMFIFGWCLYNFLKSRYLQIDGNDTISKVQEYLAYREDDSEDCS